MNHSPFDGGKTLAPQLWLDWTHRGQSQLVKDCNSKIFGWLLLDFWWFLFEVHTWLHLHISADSYVVLFTNDPKSRYDFFILLWSRVGGASHAVDCCVLTSFLALIPFTITIGNHWKILSWLQRKIAAALPAALPSQLSFVSPWCFFSGLDRLTNFSRQARCPLERPKLHPDCLIAGCSDLEVFFSFGFSWWNRIIP